MFSDYPPPYGRPEPVGYDGVEFRLQLLFGRHVMFDGAGPRPFYVYAPAGSLRAWALPPVRFFNVREAERYCQETR